MKNKKKILLSKNGWLYSNNQLYLENIYKKFLLNSKKIDKSWIYIFNKIFKKKNNNLNQINSVNIKINNDFIEKKKNNNQKFLKQKFLIFINSYRKYGHFISQLNPLKLRKKKNSIPELLYSYHNIKKEELNLLIKSDFLFFKKNINSFQDIYLFFKKKYCGYIGFEYMHISNTKEKLWLQKNIESKKFEKLFSKRKKKNILKNLIKSTVYENFINKKFPGTKRFSLEGCDSLLPMIKEIINFCLNKKITKIFLGMAHRGRLNVMHNILKHNTLNMFLNIQDKLCHSHRTGDVKYHIGLKKKIFVNNQEVEINLLNNPSHLEIITPVVIGCCKFFIENKKTIISPLPVIIHGDAAFTGQGVIQETLNMSQVPAYNVFGSIHIVINNKIAFTTSKKKYLRTSKYCTDIAKMIDSPVFHVNADKPESVISVINIALKFRYKFKKDVFIDLVGYRRLGHNEVDDPKITQPIMYSLIKKHKPICILYSKKINKSKKNAKNQYKKFYKYYFKKLNILLKNKNLYSNNSNLFHNKNIKNKNLLKRKIIYKKFKKKIYQLFNVPKNFVLHYQVKKIFLNRIKMIKNKIMLDWGLAENLAYAVLMYKGITCRLTGEDVRRGTFSHRHASVICQKTNKTIIPFKNVDKFIGSFHIWDSVLSEESVLAFEYGYSIVSSNLLNIWEAQFGDFSNGAQIVIDQFITSGLQKWGVSSSLVIMLPHGYEGQGPEHSSGRLERYLQLCAQKNIQICIPTTASQIYHLLLKQGQKFLKTPLIIFTPKSLLRHPLTFISIKKLFIEKFHKILLFKKKNISLDLISRVIFCNGKIYYELLDFYEKNNIINSIIIRIEQLYPFPFYKINKILNKYINIKYFIWSQEEPENQGSWKHIYFYFKKYIFNNNEKKKLQYVGRSKLASTAEGNFENHQKKQKKIIKLSFTYKSFYKK
ncbi:2-oxoglutarate dehydrogenase E1 component [Buchnera aphidicola]|uniref:oxoglutarate dehydrogenase (succinyl-transferring) n=1 Tax=Buchnera aphidicola subsp. Cinara cedri (strain Cc) TaxID=372461 RepID=Q057P3_BUCCC|nr:2-oxoglutarate dehydrogenase E1 component [Buchnera aphidicola]ABJ90656.1 2-oxoglutarate dehydrogenase E1 component [Buchnera aphidicola BCc]